MIKRLFYTLPEMQQKKILQLRDRYGVGIYKILATILQLFPFLSLKTLALIFNSDKHGSHFYCGYYETCFKPWRFRPLRILEIGIGGYNSPTYGGNSLYMWKSYFPFAKIVGLDIHDKKAINTARIKTIQGSQDDPSLLEKINREYGPFDIIIDDGSHLNSHQIASFKLLYPQLKAPGIYVIEDTQTSYWLNYDGDPSRNNENTFMNFAKNLVDTVNSVEYLPLDAEPDHYEATIKDILFAHNIVILNKTNAKPSSNLLNPQRTSEELAKMLGT